MHILRKSLVALLLIVPFTVSAVEPVPLRVADQDIVSRGDFIRAAIDLLNVPVSDVRTSVLPYKRIPRGLQDEVRIAHEHGALELFGDDLQLARGIKRGEALYVLMKLGNYPEATTRGTQYRDVRQHAVLESPVAVAISEGWMEPLSGDLFGVRRTLLGREGTLLLRKVRGDASTPTSNSHAVQPVKTATVRVNVAIPEATPPLPKSQILETIWGLINQEYLYTEDIDPDEAAYRAAEGLVKSLDEPYTTFMRPKSTKAFQTQIRGELSGIGAQVEMKDGHLTVVTPLRGSPAEDAGLLPGDQILSVNGTDLTGMALGEAVDLVRGPKGSTAELVVRRKGLNLNIEVVRDVIKVPEIDVSWQGDIAIVRLLQFGQITKNDLRGELEAIQRRDPKGIILDLRNNPGGLLDAAQSVLSHFLPDDTPFVKVKTRLSERTDRTRGTPVIRTDVPMVLLINEGSASASEIVAGALQDHKRATLVGKKTFGKGTVQQVLQFNDQSSLKMTIAEWFTPRGRKINEEGIHPDIIVEQEERDEQMAKALELLR